MKKYFKFLFILTLGFIAHMNILAQNDSCEVRIPGDATMVAKSTTIKHNNHSYVIEQYIDVKVTGNNNTIILRKGSVATILGNNNDLYVSAKCTVNLPGNNNKLWADRDSTIKSIGFHNSITRCDDLVILGRKGSSYRKRSKSDDLGLRDAVKILSDLGKTEKRINKRERKHEKKDEVLAEASAHPSNHLIGTWEVVSASSQGQEFPTSGKIILNKMGLGYQDYEVKVLGEKYPQIGLFKWRSDDSTIYVNENEDFPSIWKRLVNKKNFQKVEIKLQGGVRAQLILNRIK